MTEYAIVIVRLSEEDGGGYLGYAPDLPGCMSDGATMAEAAANAEAALAEWLDGAKSLGHAIPMPGDAARRAGDRERKLVAALQAYVDYSQSADRKIRDLERKLSELIAVLKDEAGRPRIDLPRTDVAAPVRRRPH